MPPIEIPITTAPSTSASSRTSSTSAAISSIVNGVVASRDQPLPRLSRVITVTSSASVRIHSRGQAIAEAA